MATYVVYDEALDHMIAVASDEVEAELIARHAQRWVLTPQAVHVYDASTCTIATDDPLFRAVLAAAGGTAL